MITQTEVRRPLTASELDGILTTIQTSGNPLLDGLVATFDALLADIGLSWADFDDSRSLDPQLCKIPEDQWRQISKALLDRAGSVSVALDWMNYGPSGY